MRLEVWLDLRDLLFFLHPLVVLEGNAQRLLIWLMADRAAHRVILAALARRELVPSLLKLLKVWWMLRHLLFTVQFLNQLSEHVVLIIQVFLVEAGSCHLQVVLLDHLSVRHHPCRVKFLFLPIDSLLPYSNLDPILPAVLPTPPSFIHPVHHLHSSQQILRTQLIRVHLRRSNQPTSRRFIFSLLLPMMPSLLLLLMVVSLAAKSRNINRILPFVLINEFTSGLLLLHR